jgi:hypothetical protein
MNAIYQTSLEICKRHAKRLLWAKARLRHRLPLTATAMTELTEEELAVLDQFSMRFAKLQDAMGTRLFPAVLELSKESGELAAFLDKLNRLEKIGALPSAERWLLLREMRNQFSHDYPDDLELQSSILNKAFVLSDELLLVLNQIELFASKYL